MDLLSKAVGAAASMVSGAATVLAPPVAPAEQAPFSEDALRLIVYQLWHGDARLQRDVLDDNYAHDALFTAGAASSVLGPGSAFATGAAAEAPAAAAGAGAGGTEAAAPAGSGDGEGAAGADEGAAAADGGGQAREAEVVQVGGAPLLVQVRGVDAMARVLRGLQLLGRVTPEIRSVAIHSDRALILATLHIAYYLLPLTWWRPVRAEALIALRFGAGGKITAHAHAGSWASLIWAPLWQNPIVDWLMRRWAPLSGAFIAALVRYTRQARGGKGLHLPGRKHGAETSPAAAVEAAAEAAARAAVVVAQAAGAVASAAASTGAGAAALAASATVQITGVQPPTMAPTPAAAAASGEPMAAGGEEKAVGGEPAVAGAPAGVAEGEGEVGGEGEGGEDKAGGGEGAGEGEDAESKGAGAKPGGPRPPAAKAAARRRRGGRGGPGVAAGAARG